MVRILRLVSSMIMVHHLLSELLKSLLKLASQSDPSEIGRKLKYIRSDLPTSTDVDVCREIATFPRCIPLFPFESRRIERTGAAEDSFHLLWFTQKRPGRERELSEIISCGTWTLSWGKFPVVTRRTVVEQLWSSKVNRQRKSWRNSELTL